MATQAATDTMIPDHVPPSAVLPFDPWSGMENGPHEALERARPYGAVVFSPRHHIAGFAPNGCWMITSSQQARKLLLDSKRFSSQNTTGIPQALGETFQLAPIESDAPFHMVARAALNPLFAPKAMKGLEDKIRERTNALIDQALAKGEVDFVSDFAKILPSEIFLDLMGLPHSRLAEFLEWEEMIMGSTDIMVRVQGLQSVANYLREEIRIRAENPTGDVLSTVVHSERDGVKLSQSDALGTAILLYIAGLDTVVNTLCWQFRHLASTPADQQKLRENPQAISKAVEELLRAFSIVTVTRIVTEDLEFEGMPMKKGDVISIPTPLCSRDPNEFENADVVDLERGASRHFAFGFGPHICLGMHLARVEMNVAIEQWLARVPEFRIKEGARITAHGGAVLSIDTLPLVWS